MIAILKQSEIIFQWKMNISYSDKAFTEPFLIQYSNPVLIYYNET